MSITDTISSSLQDYNA